MGYVSLDPTPPSRLRDLLDRIFWPPSWSMQSSYNIDYDKFMRTAINLGMITIDEITNGRNYTVRVGPHRVWISNYPYAYATTYLYAYATTYVAGAEHGFYSGRPSIQTIRALRKTLTLMGITGD